MSIIKKLDTAIANKIAAGEVIERLANVVKELVENSLDAEATAIDIDLLDSGLKAITVTDNGIGMDASNARLAFERHATSKIANINDLFRISSLGFRGEALPSIAAVSRVEMVTANQDQGVRIVVEDGRFIEETSASANRGTKISVTRLFYTTPARFKYLKSAQYELAMIVQLVDRFALAYPKVSFRLTNDQKLQFMSPGSGLIIDILANVYSKDIARQMIPFSGKNRDYEIHGFTSNPIMNRSSANYIHIFVNRRPVSDTRIQHQIRECYEQLLPKNRYPITLLYIESDPSIVDVNIHPRKLEIKFSEYQRLLELITKTIRPLVSFETIYQAPVPSGKEQIQMQFHETPREYPKKDVFEEAPSNTTNPPVQETAKSKQETIPDMAFIGQYAGTYLIFQNDTGLYLVDQHAAAERIRYERYQHVMAKRHTESQTLLVPLQLDLSKDVMVQLEGHQDALYAFGLVGHIEGSRFFIDQIPTWFFPGYELVYAEAVIMTLIEEKTLTSDAIIDDLAKLLACKHSLKANHYITEVEAMRLLEDLRHCERPYTCPHGRPIIVTFKVQEIERWFNRVI